MKLLNPLLLASLLLAGSLDTTHAQPTTNLQLRLEPRTNAIDLVVDGDAASGAFFIYQANTLEALSASPTVAVQTNTPLTNGLRFSLPAPGASPSQAFFTASHWPGRTVGDVLCGGTNMAFIPAGPFVMGDTLNDYPGGGEQPVHTVQVSAFCMDKHEVTKALWDEVYSWAITHGYSFDYANSGQGKAASHPAHSMSWYDAVKWCNARSEKEGRTPAYYTSAAQTTVYRSGQVSVDNSWVKWSAGYRLPTEAEWEKAARGGLSGRRFPWGDTISHAQANYYGYPVSSGGYAYDLAPLGYHPAYNDGVYPYTSPVGSFAANGYGLYDMAGNVWEWCSDWSGAYSSGSQTDPRGPTSGSFRVIRGGSWRRYAIYCRSAGRYYGGPVGRNGDFGFRSVLPPGQP